MSGNLLQTIDIHKFKSLFPENFGSSLKNDLFIAELHHDKVLEFLSYPVRLDAYIALFCLDGQITFDVNLSSYPVKKNTLVISLPGNIIRVSFGDLRTISKNHFLLVAISRKFASSLHFDFNKLFNESLTIFDKPSLTLDGQYLRICTDYISLAESVMASEVPDKDEIMASLISSLFMMYGSVWNQKLTENHDIPAQSARNRYIMESFLDLVTEHHDTERGMGFYAEKLGLTPKYLSKLIKSISGRSAPDWIDSFVILEAKNMLKYSNIPIKDIVRKLNFANQSVFYKYFKAHTGMTPSDYRRS